jgi:MraZ protein
MYIGQYVHTLDKKNRMFLPAKFRNSNKKYFITKGLENCLYLYDLQGWEKVLNKLENLSIENKIEERAFKRAILSGAHELELDSQGRVLVPQPLCEHAKIKSEVMIIGVGVRLEIWDKTRWDSYYESHAKISFKKLSSKLEF